jgi:hypothetical protein
MDESSEGLPTDGHKSHGWCDEGLSALHGGLNACAKDIFALASEECSHLPGADRRSLGFLGPFIQRFTPCTGWIVLGWHR